MTPLAGSNEDLAARVDHCLLQLNPFLNLGRTEGDVHIHPVAENLAQEVLVAILVEHQLSTVWGPVSVLFDHGEHRNGFIVVLDYDEPRRFRFNRVSSCGKQLFAHGEVKGDLRPNRVRLREGCAGHGKICDGEECDCCDPFHDSVSFW